MAWYRLVLKTFPLGVLYQSMRHHQLEVKLLHEEIRARAEGTNINGEFRRRGRRPGTMTSV